MTKGNGVKTKLDIQRLQDALEVIKTNDLVHLAQDIRRVDDKVEANGKDNKEAHDRFELKIDAITIKMVKIIAIATCIWAIVGIIAVPLLAAWIARK